MDLLLFGAGEKTKPILENIQGKWELSFIEGVVAA
jgi:hypothetical protein